MPSGVELHGLLKYLNLLVVLMQLDVASSQLLVTDNDFRDPEFRQQLSETVNSLLALRVVPIFNENDAISTRKSPYQVILNSLWEKKKSWSGLLPCVLLFFVYFIIINLVSCPLLALPSSVFSLPLIFLKQGSHFF